jgi:hypothetical protein
MSCVAQTFVDVIELLLFVTPVLYLARFQLVTLKTRVSQFIAARRQKKVLAWRRRHASIMNGQAGADIDYGKVDGDGGGGGGAVDGGLSSHDRHNINVISDTLDEIAKQTAIESSHAVRQHVAAQSKR